MPQHPPHSIPQGAALVQRIGGWEYRIPLEIVHPAFKVGAQASPNSPACAE